MLEPVNADFFTDVVTIYPIETTQGVRGGEIPILANGVEMLTMIQRAIPSSINTHLDNTDTLHRAGLTNWNLIFATDPGISAAGQTIHWSSHAGVTKSPPFEMTTLGAAEPPGGGLNRFTVACYSRS